MDLHRFPTGMRPNGFRDRHRLGPANTGCRARPDRAGRRHGLHRRRGQPGMGAHVGAGLDVVSPEAASTATEVLFSATEFILTATTLEGCAASDTVFVDVLLELDIPSGFTPNADGINDAWNLGGLDQYPSAEITLFNRWGDVLLTYGSTDGSWDGTLNGIPVPVGTYYYHIRVNEPALQAEWTGPITLMR